jgi:histidinol phosphatase-like enzyme (inositol monophosphatase family)
MKLLDAVTAVAKIAGDEALKRFQSNVAIETKSDGSPVTEADREAERAARAWIENHFPEDGIIGEELGETRPDAKRKWFLDPIDGTKSFVRGVPTWGSMVAVVEGEVILAGAIDVAAQDEMVAAEKGEGCFWNGKRCQVSEKNDLATATVLTTEIRAITSDFARLAQRSAVARTWGDCYGYVLVATGRAEAMFDPELKPWDSAALFPIIEEAGGVFTNKKGERTGLGGSAIATNKHLADRIREILAPAPNEFSKLDLDALDFSKSNGLVTVVTQHARTGEVLMVAHADRESLEKTSQTGEMHYRSRTRGLWHKGATSGNTQRVISLDADCDGDAILARVIPAGPACHTGDPTCFHDAPPPNALDALDRVIANRAASPQPSSYTNKLLADRNLRLKKIGEEASELVVALADQDHQRAKEEAADVVYHALVGLRALGLGLEDVREVLARRHLKPVR